MKYYFIVTALLLTSHVQAQFVDSIEYTPIQPQPGDTITFYCHVTYPYYSCPLIEKDIYRFGTDIFAKAFHCESLPAPAVLCRTIDTFKITTHPQIVGAYTFYYMPGFSDVSPCQIPILSPGDTLQYPAVIEQIEVNVGTTSSVILQKEEKGSFIIFPNPANEQVTLHWQGNERMNFLVEIYDATGKIVKAINMNNSVQKIDISNFDNGLYLIKLQVDGQIITEKLLIQH